ncbi:phosphatidate cytidylyltransferase [uncultured Lamprocystis sp.]|jgi:phosphatidate cytidylyltransferase|uniref:phosphatidate cytidylyltransferase n=1 Tax=uncultured Lamprocystis sp. TaxID=543132 RepID=UPI0025EED6B0|nr:phosphatidate cytidylyltransferase [uncultured Lamprocystis sp.]
MIGISQLRGGSSLRQRTWTAVILGPVVIGAVLWLPPSGFAVFLALVVLVGAWEWGGLVGLETRTARGGYLGLVAVIIGGLWFAPDWRPWIIGLGVGWWVIQVVILTRIRRIDPRSGPDVAAALAGLLVLSAPWGALVQLRASAATGPLLVLFLFLLVWIADSAAYFVGRRWGRAKLAPVLSPGKTLAGVYGALVSAVLGGLILSFLFSVSVPEILLCAVLCAITVAISIVGDLYESLLKRRRGVKDSGQLLPGHGGMLDRIDSLTAAAPVFTLGISYLGWVHP